MISTEELFRKGDNGHCRYCGSKLIYVDIDNQPVHSSHGNNDDTPIDTDTLNFYVVKCVVCKTCKKRYNILWLKDTPYPLYHKELLRLCNPYSPEE